MKLKYHDLLDYGVQDFRIKAGYIPPKMDFAVDGFIPRVTFIQSRSIFYYPDQMPNIEIELRYIELHVAVCWECLKPFRDFHPTISIYANYFDEKYCECCGKEMHNDIPF